MEGKCYTNKYVKGIFFQSSSLDFLPPFENILLVNMSLFSEILQVYDTRRDRLDPTQSEYHDSYLIDSVLIAEMSPPAVNLT